jgi:hypothetical protein
VKSSKLLPNVQRISTLKTREMLLSGAGYLVTSAVGRTEAALLCGCGADLLVLGYSVPSPEKKEVIACYREYSTGPILSLLRSDQPEATWGKFPRSKPVWKS